MVKQLKGERHESNWKHMNQDTRKRFCKFSAFFFGNLQFLSGRKCGKKMTKEVERRKLQRH